MRREHEEEEGVRKVRKVLGGLCESSREEMKENRHFRRLWFRFIFRRCCFLTCILGILAGSSSLSLFVVHVIQTEGLWLSGIASSQSLRSFLFQTKALEISAFRFFLAAYKQSAARASTCTERPTPETMSDFRLARVQKFRNVSFDLIFYFHLNSTNGSA